MMVKCRYDLHIHSSLSPCASCDMTPLKIIEKAATKGADFIAVTDHNSAKNVQAIYELAKMKEIVVIPGIEVETYEGIHMLCYFRTLKDLELFDQIVYKNVPKIGNKENFYGEQLILNKDDCVMSKEVKMLLNSTNLKVNELINLVHLSKGIVVPAHIDRDSYSILTVLGFIPETIKIDAVEISSKVSKEDYEKKFNQYRILQNSDAHYIEDVCEKMNSIMLEEKNIQSFFNYFGDRL